MIREDPRNDFPYVTRSQFNTRFNSVYDSDLEYGGTAPPSENTLKKAYLSDPNRKVWKGPELKLFTLPDFEEFEAEQIPEINNNYMQIKNEIMEHLFGDPRRRVFITSSELEEKLATKLATEPPLPEWLDSEEIGSDPYLMQYLEKELPAPLFSAITEYIIDPVAYQERMQKSIETPVFNLATITDAEFQKNNYHTNILKPVEHKTEVLKHLTYFSDTIRDAKRLLRNHPNNSKPKGIARNKSIKESF